MKKHVLDNSLCTEKLTMPNKARIAEHWSNGEKAYEIFGYHIDWGEPSCWGCGIWDESKDIDLSNLDYPQIFRIWNKHYYLQRCHIIPKSLGGCNCEANIVLLCKQCHKSNPDTKNSELFARWVRTRKSFLNYFYDEVNEAITSLNYVIEEEDRDIIGSVKFQNFMQLNTISVGGKLAVSTFFACLIEFKERNL